MTNAFWLHNVRSEIYIFSKLKPFFLKEKSWKPLYFICSKESLYDHICFTHYYLWYSCVSLRAGSFFHILWDSYFRLWWALKVVMVVLYTFVWQEIHRSREEEDVWEVPFVLLKTDCTLWKRKKKSLVVAVSWYDPVTFLQKEMVMRKREGCQMTNFSF